MLGRKRSIDRSKEMAAETDLADRASALLKQPYTRLVVPEPDGTYRSEILEFPGCIATGDTPAEALEAIENVADGWLQSALANNQAIPDPVDNTEFSGRLVLRMPKGLHKKAARLAEHERVSLNQFIVTCLAEQIGERARPMQNQITLNTAIFQTNLGTFILSGATAGAAYVHAGSAGALAHVQNPPSASWTIASTDSRRHTG
jgi:predicted RNase H-like HicB family nuclease